MKKKQYNLWRTILMNIDKEELIDLYMMAVRDLYDADYQEDE